jgi:hypothetical protein
MKRKRLECVRPMMLTGRKKKTCDVVYVRAVKRLNQSRATGQQRAIRPRRCSIRSKERRIVFKRRARESWKSYQYRKRRRKNKSDLEGGFLLNIVIV